MRTIVLIALGYWGFFELKHKKGMHFTQFFLPFIQLFEILH